MSEKYIAYVILSELLSARGALAMSITQIFIYALLAKEVEAASDCSTLEPILADRAAQHA
jgi:hypothetical protein